MDTSLYFYDQICFSLKKKKQNKKSDYLLGCQVVVQSLSHFWLFPTSWTAARQAFLSLTISWSSPNFMSIESDAIQPSHPDSVCVCVCGEKERERWLLSSHPITQSCLTLFDPMDCSTAGLPVPQHLPGIAQVHIHCIGEGVQPSHPLKPSSPSALNLSQDQGLFHRVICSHQMTIILELQLQHQSFQWIFRVDLP